jgi:transposase
MSRFVDYNPEQAYLLPPDVKQVLGADHLCFFVHEAVERLDLRRFLEVYSEEGGRLYHPSMMLKVWLYGYALGMTSSRRLEQRIREDLAFRYLAGGLAPDYWALNEFLRQRGGFVLGYTGEIAVSQDHLIVGARVRQNTHDTPALVPMVEQVEKHCRRRPHRVLADSGFYSNQNVADLTELGIDAYIPDPNLALELNGGPPATTIGRMQPSDPHLLAMRQKLRTEEGKQRYRQRMTMVEPVFGILKEH